MRVRRSAGIVAAAGAVIAALSVLLTTVVETSAATADPATAALSGSWVVTATVTQYTGSVTTAEPGYPVGHTGSITVRIGETCSAPGTCSVTFTPPSGFFDQATGVGFPFQPVTLRNGVANPVGYTSGYGGPGLKNCPPPPGSEFTFSFRVTQAVVSHDRDTAVTFVGTQKTLEKWCSNGAALASPEYQIIDFTAHPVGYVPPLPPTPAPTATPRPTSTASPAGVTAPSGNGSPPGVGTITHPRPSTITSSLTTPADAFSSPVSIAINAAVTVVVLLFITFPANLFNRTFDENYEEIREMVKRRLPWLRRVRERGGRAASESRRRLTTFVIVLLCGALLGGFLDPSFGFNGSSLTTLTAMLVSICFGIAAGTTVGYLYRRARHRAVALVPRALPAGLAIAVVCVIISRLSDFHPGYLYGVICGIAFTAAIPKREEAHLVAIGTTVTLVLAVIGWLVWVPLHGPASQPNAGFGLVLLDDFVGALFVGGLVGSVIGLFPLRFLPGGTLAGWSRAVWAATFGIAVFGLLQLMLRPESSSAHSTKAALVTAIVLFVVFGGASVLFRYYFYRRHRRAAAAVATAH